MNDPTRKRLGDFTIVSRQDPFSLAAADHLAEQLEKANLADREFRLQMAGISTEPVVNVGRKLIGEAVEQEPSSAFPLASLVPLILVLMTITGAVYPAIDLTAGERERGISAGRRRLAGFTGGIVGYRSRPVRQGRHSGKRRRGQFANAVFGDSGR